MPSHPERVRTAPLPAGYQFGDARRQPSVTGRSGATFLFDDETSAARFTERIRLDVELEPWRSLHMNAAERIVPRRPFTTDRDLGDERT